MTLDMFYGFMLHRLSMTNVCYHLATISSAETHKYFPELTLDFLSFSSSTTSNNSLSRTPQSTASDINSPLIQEDGDNKVLKLRFDVSQYTPEEIVVKTVDNKLMVSLKQTRNFST